MLATAPHARIRRAAHRLFKFAHMFWLHLNNKTAHRFGEQQHEPSSTLSPGEGEPAQINRTQPPSQTHLGQRHGQATFAAIVAAPPAPPQSLCSTAPISIAHRRTGRGDWRRLAAIRRKMAAAQFIARIAHYIQKIAFLFQIHRHGAVYIRHNAHAESAACRGWRGVCRRHRRIRYSGCLCR